jgi:hypothetical protein
MSYSANIKYIHDVIEAYITIVKLIHGFSSHCHCHDRLCGLVVRVPGYRSTGPGFNSRRYQIF